jgi:hypothetical protein
MSQVWVSVSLQRVVRPMPRLPLHPRAARQVDVGRMLSGVTTLLGGTWSNFSCANGLCFSGSPSANILTGGLGGMRPIITCDPNLPRSERTFDRQYRTECVQPPAPSTASKRE